MQTISFLLFRLQPPEPAVRMADIRRSSAGYTADIRDVTDGICKLCKTYNYRKELHLLKSSRWFDIKQ